MANLTEADALDFGTGPIHVLGDPNTTPEADNIDTSTGNLDYSIQSFGGDDVIVTGDGDADLTNGHTVQGGDGNDTITGGAGNDNLRGGTFNSADADGDDTINGGGGDDSIVGGLGNDTLNGGAGNDSIYGEDGNDILNGGVGRDLFYGGAGDDTIDGGDNPSEDDLDLDVLFFSHSINSVESITYDGVTGTITIVGPEGTDIATNIEQLAFSDNPVYFTSARLPTLSLGTSSIDTLNGDDGDNYMIAGAGDDIISGGLGVDSIVAGKGNDTVDAGEGNDTVLSGEGDNTIDGGVGDDLVGYNFSRNQIVSIKRDSSGVITLQHAKGTDTLINIEAFDFFPTDSDGNRTSNTAENIGINDFATVFTELDDESINGTTGDDVLNGGIGNDTIDGLAGDDTAVFDFATTAITSIQRDVDGVITLASASGTDTITNIESLQFTDQTLLVADLASTFANIDDETITGTSGDDVVDGGTGSDTFVMGYASSKVSAISNSGGTLSITGAAGTDALSNIESLEFSDQTFAVSALTIGTASAETLNGTANADLIFAAGGADTIATAAGNDTILAIAAGSNVDGGAGTDTAAFTFASTDITSAIRQADESVIITTAQGDTTLNNVEQLSFSDSSSAVTIDSILTGPKFTSIDGNGNPIQISPTPYTGAVDFLEYEHLGEATGDVVTGSEFNDFMNLLAGDDAANGGAGRDVLDGGTGSNFLTGGTGNDTFYVDGRPQNGAVSTSWSTITDFEAGEFAILWGWVEGTSQLLLTLENFGDPSALGYTYFYDLDGNDEFDSTITFTGLTAETAPIIQADVNEGYLSFVLV